MKEVLFVCVHNSARSQMAEAFLNRACPEFFKASSAGLEPGSLNPLVVEAMQELGIDISANQTKSVEDMLRSGRQFSHVITVCDGASAERCPVFPGAVERLHWSFPDPSALTGAREERLERVREIRDAIQRGVQEWCDRFCYSHAMKLALALALAGTMLVAGVSAQQLADPSARGNARGWDPAGAAGYLDARMDAWFANGTRLKTGDAQTVCVSCHAALAYAVARPVLRQVLHASAPAAQEVKLLDETTRRVDTYSSHQVLYDFNERRQTESRGTEAVLNLVILASDDASANREQPSAATQKALARLWQTQRPDGRWDWLEFGLEPWETTDAVYHGATFAAFGLGTVRGDWKDGAATLGLERLRGYLAGHFAAQHLYNRTWALLASTRLPGVLTDAQRDALMTELLARQRGDGGWSLESMGPWTWSKTAPPVTSPGPLDASLLAQSDAYATGLVVYTLRQAGVPADRAAMQAGLRWLKANQRPIAVGDITWPAWQAHSLNYDREHGGEKGEPWRRLFMSDTATAFAVLALSSSEPRPSAAAPTPRTSDGKVDFSGIWGADRRFIYDINDALKPGEALPIQPWALKVTLERLSKDDPEALCLPTGVPRQAPYPWRIVQSATHMFFLFEGNIHSYRQIFMDGRPHPDDLDPTWYGHSVGRFEGDTLVIDTVGFNDLFWFDFAGHPHTEKLHTIERYRRPAFGTLEYDVTIDDPGAYTRPFTLYGGHTYESDTELMEYICNENNQDVEHIVGKDPRNKYSKP